MVRLEKPQPLAGRGVDGGKLVTVRAEKLDAARGSEDSAARRTRTELREFPRDAPGVNVDGAQIFLGRIIGRVARAPSIESLPRLPRDLSFRKDRAAFECRNIVEARRGTVRSRPPIGGSQLRKDDTRTPFSVPC